MPALVEDVGKIEAVNATVRPRGVLRIFHGLSQVGQRKTKQTLRPAPYTERLSSSRLKRLKARNAAPYPVTTQSCEYFRPAPTL